MSLGLVRYFELIASLVEPSDVATVPEQMYFLAPKTCGEKGCIWMWTLDRQARHAEGSIIYHMARSLP